MGERPTLATIAAGVGVSKATVSKVLNGRADVSAATRARVERALADHDYVPVRRKRERVIGDPPDTAEFLRTVLSAATDADLEVVITITLRR
jgi:LacI family transcriptional regulator